MDILFEFLFELLIEGGIEISKNKKISKLIRYPIIFIIGLLFSLVIFGLIFLGILFIKENLLAGLIFIGVGLYLLFAMIIKYINKKNSLKK